MRETRDLLRRRMYLVRHRAEAIAHIQNTNSQYNLEPFGKKLKVVANREEMNIAPRFADPSVRKTIEVDLALIDKYDEMIGFWKDSNREFTIEKEGDGHITGMTYVHRGEKQT